MLNQATGDRDWLVVKLKISKDQEKFVTNSRAGEGLIFFGNTIVPFVDNFPKDTILYQKMTTKLSDMSDNFVYQVTIVIREAHKTLLYGSVFGLLTE